MQKGTEEVELKKRVCQVEEIQHMKVQRQEVAGDFTEIHTKHCDWNILCMERNGKNPNSFW